MLVEKISFEEKVKTFFKLNWWLIWIFYTLSFLSTIIFFFQAMESNKETHALLKKEIQGVVFLGQNGQVIFGEKSVLDASSNTSFQAAIKNILNTYLITDASRISLSFKNRVRTVDDVYNNSPLFQEFGKTFIARGEKYPDSVSYFKAILTGYAQGFSSNELPEKVVPIDSLVSAYSYNPQTQTFSIVVDTKVSALVYNRIKDAYDEKQGTVQIRAEGFFSLQDGNPINPLGVKFFKIGITNVKK